MGLLEKKYKLLYINGKRYYEFDMTNSLPSLDETVPYYFKYKDIEIYASAWNKMTLSILSALDEREPKTEEELLNIHYYWTKTDIFSRDKRTNYTPYKNLFLNTNHTATHAMMNIQGLLKEYNVPLNECTFYIRRHFVSEPKEVKEMVRAKTINCFSKMLALKEFDQERIGKIISNFATVNKFLSKVSPGYNDFFLFDDYYYFTNYKVKVLEYLEKKFYSEQDKNYRIIKRYLEYLDDYYKNRPLYDHLSSNSIEKKYVQTLDNEIEALFISLKSEIIVINKLYARLKMMQPQLLDSLDDFNNPKGLYFIVRVYLSKKYYFKEPFISKNKNPNLNNDEIIYSYAYSLDEITVSKINQYVDKMHLKKLDNILALFEDAADEYVQTEESKLVKKDKLDLSPELQEKIKSELLFYIDSFGTIDSETYMGYNALPNVGLEWNKYLLLGLCRSFFDDSICIKLKGDKYKKLEYLLLKKN